MKKIFTLLAMLISLGLTSEIIATNLQVASSATGFTSIDGKGVATFVVKSPIAQSCDLSFLMMPGEYEDGSFTSVTLKVNGVTLPNPITFNTYGWQSANTTGNSVSLNQGNNTVQFISGGSDVPMIRNLRLKSLDIEKYYSNIMCEDTSNVTYISNLYSNSILKQRYSGRPPVRPGVNIGVEYYNTFLLPIEYTQGDRATFYAPSNTATVDFNMYLFHEDPILFSESDTCNGNRYLFYETTIPRSGTYYLLLEAKNNNECGGVTIVVNNNTTYRNSFVSNKTFEVKKEDTLSYVFVSNTYLPYNMFTTNLKSSDVYHDADSYLYLKHEIAPQKEIVVAYNDNYLEPSGFRWGANARIRTPLRDRGRYELGLFSMYPYSYFTPDICDVYHSYWNSIDTIKYYADSFSNKFPNLIYEDAIESDINGIYNCIAYSAGITYTPVYYPNSSFETQLEWLDRFYNNETVINHLTNSSFSRPMGSIKYIRCDYDNINSVIDIWGKRDSLGNISVTHASINNPKDGYQHGYDWESKDGDLGPRFFHPREALSGGVFGSIVARYQPLNENDNRTRGKSIYEAIADDEIKIEDVVIIDKELQHLDSIISEFSIKEVEKFNNLYVKWKYFVNLEYLNQNFAYCTNDSTYTKLLDYIKEKPNLRFMAYKKFVENDIYASILIRDISNVENSKEIEIWHQIMQEQAESNIKRTYTGNINLFIKTMLQNEGVETLPETGKTRSNENDINIISNNEGVTVSIGLEKTSKCIVKAINLQTSQQTILQPESIHQAGEIVCQYFLTSGAYIIVVVIDGNINAQKVIVK